MRKALGEHFEAAAPLKADPSLRSSELRVGARKRLMQCAHPWGKKDCPVEIAASALAAATMAAILGVSPFPYNPDRDRGDRPTRNHFGDNSLTVSVHLPHYRANQCLCPIPEGRFRPLKSLALVSAAVHFEVSSSTAYDGSAKTLRHPFPRSAGSPENRALGIRTFPRRSRVSSTRRPLFLEDDPPITSRSLAKALMACSALLLFHGTSS